MKIKSLIQKIRKETDKILFFSTVLSVLLLSAGIYFMVSGINRVLERDMIILGSGIFYVSIIIFAFKL